MADPTSAATSYADAAALTARYDARLVAQLVSDTGSPASAGSLATDPNLQALLDSASGELEAACLVGGRYSPADLQALTGVSAAFLKQIVCDVAMARLITRRKPDEPLTETLKQGLAYLDLLRSGERIFGLREVAAAGVPEAIEITPVQIQDQLLMSDVARRYFGLRTRELKAYGS